MKHNVIYVDFKKEKLKRRVKSKFSKWGNSIYKIFYPLKNLFGLNKTTVKHHTRCTNKNNNKAFNN